MQTIFPDCGTAAYQGQEQEERARHFQPEHMHHAAHIASSKVARIVERPDPPVLSRSCACHSQNSAALPAKSAGRCGLPFIHV